MPRIVKFPVVPYPVRGTPGRKDGAPDIAVQSGLCQMPLLSRHISCTCPLESIGKKSSLTLWNIGVPELSVIPPSAFVTSVTWMPALESRMAVMCCPALMPSMVVSPVCPQPVAGMPETNGGAPDIAVQSGLCQVPLLSRHISCTCPLESMG